MKVSKVILDLTLALILGIVLLPLIIIVAIAIRFNLGSPVLFTQTRPGYKGKPFKIFKFRSMTDERDASGNLLPAEKRLTSFGVMLRKLSLDELPQLLNVLRLEQSLVGPRPLLMEYLPRYNKEQARRHDMLPGITGWAQINGRNAISWEKKFELDVWYVDNWSLWLDLKILFLTGMKVIKKDNKDINFENNNTEQPFMGTKE